MDTFGIVEHYGIKRRSGRYPWGSGGEILEAVDRLKSEGMTEVEIAKALNMSTTELRNQKALAKSEEQEAQRLFVIRQKEAGMSISAISKESGLPESTVRDLLNPKKNIKFQIIKTIAEVLAKAVAKYGFVDVGEGSEHYLGVSSTKMKNAIALLKNQGYPVHIFSVEQLGTGKMTTVKVLAAPGTDYATVLKNSHKIAIPNQVSADGGVTFTGRKNIKNVSSDTIQIRYSEQGGSDKDGLIEIRPRVEDLSLGGKRYAQVRIGVDGTHYLKGMAVYSNDLPPGVNIRFNTNKSDTGNKLDALKQQSADDYNPFGSNFKQLEYTNSKGEKDVSALNIVYEEGDWSSWSKNLASQFLSKQSPQLAKQQLDVDLQLRKAELDEILSLENDVVKNHLLMEYSDSLDAAAVDLKAAALPRQTTNVLIPAPSVKPTEIYAPNYKDGEVVSLVRYPHGGIFEIPTLKVNNKNPEMRDILGTSTKDAVGIHPEVAKRLSGADFDGDTVLVIPNGNGKIKTAPALDGLKGFDPQSYKLPKDSTIPRMSEETKQREMGNVSNLITDMTIKGASQAEIARAVRHSMVVIDAVKHELNYQQSYRDNGIAALKQTYQGSAKSGASTLISKTSSVQYVPQRRDHFDINKETGEKIYSYTEKTYIDKNGNQVSKRTKSTKGYEVDDAYELSSGTVVESVYADYSNSLRKLANKARLASLKTSSTKYDPVAAKNYSKEVKSLSDKLQLAERNQPLERRAQLVANELYRSKVNNNPGMSKADMKAERGKALVTARARVGALKPIIKITPQEWEAIQMGAVTKTRLERILRNADMDTVRGLATPRQNKGLTSAKQTRAQQLLDAGYTSAEVAAAVGATQSQILNMDKS